MSPAEKMKNLAALEALQVRKAAVRARIASRRTQGAAAMTELRAPLELVKRGQEIWRAIPGEAKWIVIPVGLLLVKKFGKRLGGPAALLGYAPLALEIARVVASSLRRDHGTGGLA